MNNMIKTTLKALMTVAVLSGVVGCGVTEGEKPLDPITTADAAKEYFKLGEPLKRLPQTKVDIDNMIYDGFVGPMNRDYWAVGNDFWGLDNGGVAAANVRYTDDGVLVLKAHGDFYTGDVKGVGQRTDGTRTGAAIISKFLCRPGHYEIKMKVTPRIGCCTAFWTYSYLKGEPGKPAFNSELDIELPGGGNVGDVSLEKCVNTNWYSEDTNDTAQFAASDYSDSIAHNDGEWHTYGFDWYTDPGVIVYHYDGLITQVSISNIPNLEGRLNVGVWFPVGWTGIPNFEEDVMLVDSVLYEPFKDQPIDEYDSGLIHGANTEHLYNDKPIVLKPINKVSNGNFEYYNKLDKTLDKEAFRNRLNSKGWSFTKVIGKTPKPIEELSNIVPGKGIDDSCAAFIADTGVMRQTIDSCFKGYKYNFSFFAKSKLANDTSKLKVIYLTRANQVIETEEIVVNNTVDYQEYKLDLVCPEDCRNIRIEGRTGMGNEMYLDNVNLNFVSGK